MTINHDSESGSVREIAFFRDGVISLVVLLLAFAAFDDITTDNATAFSVEYAILVACSAWLVFAAMSLWRKRRRILGGLSVLSVAAAMWAQRGMGSGIVAGFWPKYVVIISAFVWFGGLALTLIWLGLRQPHGVGRNPV